MVSGLWSNSNWDDEKDSRRKALEQIEDTYRQSIVHIYSDEQEQERSSRIDYDDPFFAAISHLEE